FISRKIHIGDIILVVPLLRHVPRYMWTQEANCQEKRLIVFSPKPLLCPGCRLVVGHQRIIGGKRAPVRSCPGITFTGLSFPYKSLLRLRTKATNASTRFIEDAVRGMDVKK